MSGEQTDDGANKTLVSFDRLPLGARFRYLSGTDVWVKIEARGDHQCGVIAKWEIHLDWLGQSICSFEESPEERAAGKVEWLDAPGGSDALAAEVKRLRAMVPTGDYVLVDDMSEENSKRWGKGLFCGFDDIKSVS